MCRFALIAVFFVGTMSIFTILVQGSTMPALLGVLGITRKTPVQMQHLLMAAKEVEDYANRNLAHLKVSFPHQTLKFPRRLQCTASQSATLTFVIDAVRTHTVWRSGSRHLYLFGLDLTYETTFATCDILMVR